MKLQTLKKRLKGFNHIVNMDNPQQNIIHFDNASVFQSYDSIVAIKFDNEVYLTKAWDYSMTTGKYRNQFLNEDKKATEQKLNKGIYKILD